jgi:hypothetical protein
MAENKYEFVVFPTITDKPPKHQPWYRERLRTKMIKTKQANSLDASRWVFLKGRADDFRTGAPEGGDLERMRQVSWLP